MYSTLSGFIKKLAAFVSEGLEAHKVDIFFSASSLDQLKTKKIKSLTDKMNFQWSALWLYFFDTEKKKYYIYRLTLKPEGSKGDTHTVHNSDSSWSLKSITSGEPATEDYLPNDVEEIFKGLFGDPGSIKIIDFKKIEEKIPVTYRNLEENKKSYSNEEFKATFIDSRNINGEPYYILFSKSEGSAQKNPFGEEVKITYTEK